MRLPSKGAAANRRWAFQFMGHRFYDIASFGESALRAPVAELGRCDMKLHLILPGWTGFLTKPCVSPQVFHGSTRLTGCGRGVEPSRKCIKPGSLKPGAG
jgi:hypothetical protein